MQKSRVLVALLSIVALAVVAIAIFAVQGPSPHIEPNTAVDTEGTSDVYADIQATEGQLDVNSRLLSYSDHDNYPIFSDSKITSVDREVLAAFLSNRPVSSYRLVSVDSDDLREIIRRSDVEDSFQLLLLDDQPITFTVTEAEEYSSGWQSGIAAWRGAIDGEEMSSAVFVISPSGELSGDISSSLTGLVKVEKVPDTNLHVIWKWADDFSRSHD